MRSLEEEFYRYRALYQRGGIAKALAEKWYYLIQIIHSCEIPLETKIGEGVKFGHRGIGIVIHKESVVGAHVHIMQNVTIGAKNGYAPVIGNNVLVGTGAVILGKVTVGENAVVGANAVVTKDVPPGTSVGGIPAQALRRADKI